MNKPLMILISGPYMSGTNGDESAIAKNLKAMEDYALPIFSKGHLAVVGEWLAWPVIRQAGGNSHSSDQFTEYQYPVAHRLLEKCDNGHQHDKQDFEFRGISTHDSYKDAGIGIPLDDTV
jgi:hypothetical protein